ncbi:MAG: ABC transporter permease [Breznakibacter sp.]
MGPIRFTLRRLFRKGEHPVTRIVSLAMGLAFGMLILSEVFYYYSFDGFYPDADRIYVVHENFKVDETSDKMELHPRVSGAIAPGLKAEVPGIEAACRMTDLGKSVFYTSDQKGYEAKFVLADEHLFEVLPRPMISGTAAEILKTPMLCMVSDKIAGQMGGNVIGKEIELKEFPGKKLRVAGIFEALPENTNYKYDVLVSMPSIGQFMWNGTENWLGNDRYYACVKLQSGVSPASLAPAVRKMQEKHQDIAKLELIQGGEVLKYSFEPITKIHAREVGDMVLILSAIAFAVLFVSIMNYMLLTFSALANRAKTSAIYKCCGAQVHNLHWLIFSETFLLFALSLSGAFLLIVALKPVAEVQMGHRLSSVLNPEVVWPLLGLLTVLLALISYLPGRFFSNIPVAAAFRDYRQKKGKWKLILLSFQFAGASFILTVLTVVTLQYNKMRNADHGYQTKGVYSASTSGIAGPKIPTVLNELKRLPEIETVALGCETPLSGGSGNNVMAPDDEKELFNVVDFYWIDEHYLSLLGIPVTEGQNFSPATASSNDILISRKGAQMMAVANGWGDGVIGKTVRITQHTPATVRGVFPDFIINSIADPDSRPAAFFYLPQGKFEQFRNDNPGYSFFVLIKAHQGAEAGLREKIADVINLALPHQDAEVKSLDDEQLECYTAEKGFRNAMVAGNVVILLITAIGLLAYTTNEALRRSKELAIRTISGATPTSILRLFVKELGYVAVPAIVVGLVAAWLTVARWMQNFAMKIPLHWEIFILSSFSVLLMIMAIAAVNYSRMAGRNPVETLRYE